MSRRKSMDESDLESLRPYFHDAFPRLASGKYVHFFVLRYTQSFPIFQTDGALNTVQIQAGLDLEDETSRQRINRLVMFKRKQVAPERLTGRQLLRSLGFMSAIEGETNFCEYTNEKSCQYCPDCILYGFGIGGDSERSKVYSDSPFSLSPYEISHRSFTFNAPSERGTMSEKGKMRNAINNLDHILPEVAFPCVETLRDSTFEGFIYVLGNLLRTRRYGAQESRTGTIANHVVGIVFCDEEIFSNLHFTQAIYDGLNTKRDAYIPIGELLKETARVAEDSLTKEPVRTFKKIFGTELENVLQEVTGIYQNENRVREVVSLLCQQSRTFSETYGSLFPTRQRQETEETQTIEQESSTEEGAR